MRVMKIKEIRKYKNIHRIMKDFLMIRYMCLAVIFIMIILAGLIGILSIKYHSDTDIAFLLLAGICILIGIILQIAIQDNRIDPESLQRADSELPDSLRFAGRKGAYRTGLLYYRAFFSHCPRGLSPDPADKRYPFYGNQKNARRLLFQAQLSGNHN